MAFAGLFVIVLIISAILDKSIRVLHSIEALPYIIGPIFCLKRSKMGYAISFASGAFWFWSATFLTSFVRNGFEQLYGLIRTGAVARFDILIAVPAAIGTGGMAICALTGYLRLPGKSIKDSWLFLSALVLITGFFLAIFKLLAPNYLEMFRGIFFK